MGIRQRPNMRIRRFNALQKAVLICAVVINSISVAGRSLHSPSFACAQRDAFAASLFASFHLSKARPAPPPLPPPPSHSPCSSGRRVQRPPGPRNHCPPIVRRHSGSSSAVRACITVCACSPTFTRCNVNVQYYGDQQSLRLQCCTPSQPVAFECCCEYGSQHERMQLQHRLHRHFHVSKLRGATWVSTHRQKRSQLPAGVCVHAHCGQLCGGAAYHIPSARASSIDSHERQPHRPPGAKRFRFILVPLTPRVSQLPL
jgi:hypothetical protein